MQQTQKRKRWWLAGGALLLAALLWWGRSLVWLAVKHLFPGLLAALAALPLMKRFEKRFSPGLSAAFSIAALNALLAAAFFLIIPSLAAQVRQLAAMLPELWVSLEKVSEDARNWLSGHGLGISAQAQAALLQRGQDVLASAIPGVVSRLSGMAGGMGQWLLAPVFGFYFLRDRRMISGWLLALLPAGWRTTAVNMLREMRRETAGYLRGQLLLSAAVGGLSAAGLLLCGVPSWLALGAVMGVLELIPYVGPVIGVMITALFVLPLGWWRMLWALGAMVLVQQLEGSVLSPRLIGQSTRLHPAVVILCAVLGGAAAGVKGILLAVPLLLCVRAAFRVLLLQTSPAKSFIRYKWS